MIGLQYAFMAGRQDFNYSELSLVVLCGFVSLIKMQTCTSVVNKVELYHFRANLLISYHTQLSLQSRCTHISICASLLLQCMVDGPFCHTSVLPSGLKIFNSIFYLSNCTLKHFSPINKMCLGVHSV